MSAGLDSTEAGGLLTDDRRDAAALARRSGFNFVGVAASTGLQFVLLIVLSRGLGQHDAGVFFEAYAAVRVLSVVAALGLDVTVIRYVAFHRARGEGGQAGSAVRQALIISAALSVLVAAVVWALAPQAAGAFGSEELEFVLRVMVLSLPVLVLEMVLIGATRGTGRMTAFVVIDQILDGVVRLAAVVGVLALGYGLRGVAVTYALAGVITLAAAAVPARKIVFAPLDGVGTRLAELLRFTTFQWGGIVAAVGLLWIDTLLLGLWRPPSDVAVYTVATRTVLLGMIFILPIGVAFQPMIGRLYARGQWASLQSMYVLATKWSTIVACPPLLFVALFATPTIGLFYGESYAAGAWPLAILAIGQTVNAATGPCGHIATMSGRSDLVFWNSMVALAVNIILNVLLIPPYGMMGAGIAWAVSIVVMNLYRLWQVWRLLRMHPFLVWPRRVAVALGAFLAIAGVLRLSLPMSSPLLQLVVAATASGIAYGALLIALGVVQRTDGWIPAPITRFARFGR